MNLGFLRALEPLPSSSSAADLIEGKPGAFGRAFLHTVGRAALIGTGLYAAGYRGKEVVKGSVAASLAIEAFALAWFGVQKSSGGMSGMGELKKCCIQMFVLETYPDFVVGPNGKYIKEQYVLHNVIQDCKTGALIEDLGPTTSSTCPTEDVMNPPKKCAVAEQIFGNTGLYNQWVKEVNYKYGVNPWDTSFQTNATAADIAHEAQFDNLYKKIYAYEHGTGQCPTKDAKALLSPKGPPPTPAPAPAPASPSEPIAQGPVAPTASVDGVCTDPATGTPSGCAPTNGVCPPGCGVFVAKTTPPATVVSRSARRRRRHVSGLSALLSISGY